MLYFDYNASAPLPVWPELSAEKIYEFLGKSAANPSSLHSLGRKSRRLINQAADAVAKFIRCDAEFLYWTSGASESNSWALHSAFELALGKGKKEPCFVLSQVEHESTQLAAKAMQEKGAKLIELAVLPSGVVDTDHLNEILSSYSVDLVSVLYANNETGVIQPIQTIANLCQNARGGAVPLHVDCVQALGKIDLNLKQLGATYACFSGHKIGAPKGVGWIVVQPDFIGRGRLLSPLIYGKQQKGLRGGTENSFGVAIVGEIIKSLLDGKKLFPEYLAQWHRDFEAKLSELISGTLVHGKQANRLGNTSYIGFEGTDGDGVLMNLDLEGICASSGSACTSGSIDPSPVLLAMGCDKRIARSSIRFSSGHSTQWSDFEAVLNLLPEIVDRVRRSRKEIA